MNTLPVKLMKLDHTKIAKNKLTPSPLIYTYLVTWLREIKNHIEKCVKSKFLFSYTYHSVKKNTGDFFSAFSDPSMQCTYFLCNVDSHKISKSKAVH